MTESTTYVGLGVQAERITVAVLQPGSDESAFFTATNSASGLERLAERLRKLAADGLLCCSEAGCCGYHVQRELLGHEVAGQVIAPHLILPHRGRRVQTDRRNAHQPARQLRAGQLSRVLPPTADKEGLRDLVRDRDACRQQVKAAQQRITACCHKKVTRERQKLRAEQPPRAAHPESALSPAGPAL